MISLEGFVIDYVSKEMGHLVQGFDPRDGKHFESYDDVCNYLSSFEENGETHPIVEEAIKWFEENKIKIPNSLFANRIPILKKKKEEEIKADKLAALAKGVEYKGKHYQYDANGKSTILSMRLAILTESITEFPISFKTYENTYEQLTKDEFVEMTKAALEFETQCLLRKDACIKALKKAKTVEAIEKIKFEE